MIKRSPTLGPSYQLWRSVKAGVFSEGGARREEIATIRALHFRDFLFVSFLYVVVKSVNGSVSFRALSTSKVELRVGVVE